MDGAKRRIRPAIAGSGALVAWLAIATSAAAQPIVPADDGTRTTVTVEGNRFEIEGGRHSEDGRNLFHSFQEFGLEADQVADFLSQPEIANILSRVVGGNPSVINGLLQVTGGDANLFLMNPAGIVFGTEARLNISGDFTATTATGIGFEEGWFEAFGSNNYSLLGGDPQAFAFDVANPGAILNAGDLGVGEGRSLALVGGEVLSTGNLSAPGGNIAIAAVPGENLVRVSLPGHVLSLEIEPPRDASGRLLPVTPQTVLDLLAGATVETGVEVTATGEIRLADSGAIAPTAGSAIVSGQVDVVGETGGRVLVLGDRVGVLGGEIDASGRAGGGEILMGGDLGGEGTLPVADRAWVDRAAIVRADALVQGEGGRIGVWSQTGTVVSGELSARGGTEAGNGGFIEISARDALSFAGSADVSAANGSNGTVLIDPRNINIVAEPDFEAENDGELDDGQIFDGDGGDADFTISDASLTAIEGNIVLEATRNITAEDDADLNFSNQTAGESITFDADRDIEVDTDIQTAGGAIDFEAGGDLSVENINTSPASGNGGNVTLTADGDVSTDAIVTAAPASGNGGNVTLTADGNVSTDAIVTAAIADGNGGHIEITSRNGSIDTTTSLGFLGLLGSSFGLLVSSSNNGDGGNVTLTADGEVRTGAIVTAALADGKGGNIEIASNNGSIDTTTSLGFLGFLSRRSGLLVSSSNNGDGGNVTLQAADDINAGIVFSASPGDNGGNGGNITLTSDRGEIDTTFDFDVSNLTEDLLSGLGVNDELASQLTSLLEEIEVRPQILAFSETGNGGAIALDGGEGIAAGFLDASGLNGGTVDLDSTDGNIEVDEIDVQGGVEGTGGAIALDGDEGIAAGFLDASGLNGGTVALNSVDGDIEVSAIDAQGGMEGSGGRVGINTDFLEIPVSLGFFSASEAFADGNDIDASISTVGGLEGGEITIVHGGNDEIPFTVGDPEINGTAGALSSDRLSIANESFPFTALQENISIIARGEISVNPEQLRLDPVSAAPAFTQDIQIISLERVRQILQDVEVAAGIRPALIYPSFVPTAIETAEGFVTQESALTQDFENYLQLPSDRADFDLSPPPADDDELELSLVTARGTPIRIKVSGATRERVLETAQRLYEEISNPDKIGNTDYLAASQQLYRWLVEPLEAELQTQEIDNLLFVMPAGLRQIPIAVLHDGEQFVAQKYSSGLAPSLSLTDTRYREIDDVEVLAMGSSVFPTDEDLFPLPAVQLELPLIAEQLWDGEFFINEGFTLENLKTARQRTPYGIIHLATHADFQPGDLENTYIQLYDRKVQLPQIRELGFNDPPVELLILSACRTAYGNEQAELGFAGMAVQTGVKTAMASLWYVGDTGTLALMSEFYRTLKEAPIKAEAMRLAQVAMIEGQVVKEGKEIVSTRGRLALPPEAEAFPEDLSHPFYWAAFTTIGSPW